MFDFIQAIFAKVTAFVVGIVIATGMASPPIAQPQEATSTPQAPPLIVSEIASSTNTTNSEIVELKKEIQQLKKQQATTKQVITPSTARTPTAPTPSTQTAPVPSPSSVPIRTTYPIAPLPDISSFSLETQQAARAAYSKMLNTPDLKYKTPDEQASLFNKLIMEEVARIKAEKSQTNLSRAANNKAEMIELADKFINAQKEIQELISYELSFVNETINKLTGHNDESTNILRKISIIYRDFLIRSASATEGQIRNGEGIKSAAQTMSVEAFVDEQAVMSRRQDIHELLDGDIMSSLKQAAAQYRDDIRLWLQY